MIKNPVMQIGAITVVISLFVIPTNTAFFLDDVTGPVHHSDDFTIKVALYDAWGINNRYFSEILDYNWTINNQSYQFAVTIIGKDDVLGDGNNTLTNNNFDVFIIGASADSYLSDGLDDTWKGNIQRFVANGGGYIGVCGGANAASQGFENPKNPFHKRVNKGVLGLADVYINNNFFGEWQYLLKFGFDAFSWDNDNGPTPFYVSVNTSVEKNTGHPIFSVYDGKFRYITYAGGPGMYIADKADDKLGTIIPLLRYNEEPMFTKPLHYWIPSIRGWKILGNVTTNLYGTLAGLATTYNSTGRVVLYGPHPEDRVVVNGHINEYLGYSMINFVLPFKTYVFNYFGTELERDYNWGIIRRSVAWAGKIASDCLPSMY